MSSENPSDSQVHQEGIDHIKSQTGTDDSAGISKDSGGVSSSAYVASPVPSEQKSVVQSTVDTVRGYLAGMSLGGGSTDTTTTTTKEEVQKVPESKSSEEGTSSSAAGGGIVASTAAGASAAAAAVVGSKESTTEESTKKKEEEANDSSAGVTATDSATTTNQSAPPTTTSATAAKDEPMADTPQKDDTTKRRDDDADNKVADAPGEGSSAAKKDNWPKENRDAIPTAGGEKLGEKHWGESQMVPDVPKPQGEGANVSSTEGQPDSQTRDNTSKNTGGAAPPSSSNNGAAAAEDGEGKQKFTDKIKDKLNIGKKE